MVMVARVRLCLVAVFAVLSASTGAAAEFDNCAVLSSSNGIKLHWTVRGSDIDIGISHEMGTGSQLDVGLYPPSAQRPHNQIKADVWVMGRQTGSCPAGVCTGQYCIIDANMPDKEVFADGTGNLRNVAFSTYSNGWMFNFTRALATGDGTNDRDIRIDGTKTGIIFGCNADPLDACKATKHDLVLNSDPPAGCLGQKDIDFGASSTCNQPNTSGGVFLSGDGSFKLEVSQSVPGSEMQFKVTAQIPNGNGWAAFGWADIPGAAHIASQMYVMWVSGGTGNIVDASSSSLSMPTPDATPNFNLVSATESGGETIIVFTRPFSTGDANDLVIADKPVLLQWAVHAGADPAGASSYAKHSNAGTGTMNFVSGGSSAAPPPAPSTPGTTPTGGGNSFTSPDGDFKLTFEQLPNKAGFKFTMEADTTGWLAFGWTEVGAAHSKSEMFVGWVQGGTATVQDSWSNSKSSPSADAVNDLVVESGTESSKTEIIFTRVLDTGNANDDLVLEDKEVLFQWAFSSSDDPSAIHSKRGTAKLNFFSGAGEQPLFEMSAGLGLCFIVIGIFVLWVAVHYGRKLQNKLIRKKRQGELNSRGHGIQEVHAQATAGYQHVAGAAASSTQVAPHSEYARGVGYFGAGPVNARAATTHVNPRATIYFKGTSPVRITEAQAREQAYLWGGDTDFYGSAGKFPTNDWQDDGVDNVEMYAASDAPPLNSEYGKFRFLGNNDNVDHSAIDKSYVLSGHQAKSGKSGVSVLLGKVFKHRVPKTDLSVLDVILILLYVGLNVLCAFIWAPASVAANGWSTEAVAQVLGSLTGGNSFLVVVPGTRNSPLVWTLGIAFDRTIFYHRMLGRILGALCAAHFFTYIAAWAEADSDFVANVGGELDLESTRLFGLFGFICMVILLITAYGWFRRNHFNLFFFSHFLFFGFYLFGALHVPEMSYFVFAAAIWYGIDRLVRLLHGAIPRKAKLEVKSNGVLRVQFPRNFLGKYRVGQYVFLNFPQVSLIEWHPFSLSSSPLEDLCEVHIKNLGDHTRALNEAAQAGKSLWVRQDGPNGKFGLNFKRYPIVYLVGGGIGCTPLIGVLKTIYRIGASAKRDAKAKRSSVVKAVYFVWSVPDEAVYDWFSEVIEAAKIVSDSNPEFPKLHLHVHATRQDASEFSPAAAAILKASRPNLKAITKEIAQDPCGDRVACIACGPAPLVQGAWDECVKRSKKSKAFDFHHETFDF